jgi:hypothetical protein
MTGGIAETGIFLVPWIPLLLWVMTLVGTATTIHMLRGGTVGGPSELGTLLRRELSWRSRSSRAAWMFFFALFWVPMLTFQLLGDWDPLSASGSVGPGPAVAEVRDDGLWEDDSIEHASSWSWAEGDPCLSECPGPRYVYRVKPGEAYSFVATVRNDGPGPVTLLGPSHLRRRA